MNPFLLSSGTMALAPESPAVPADGAPERVAGMRRFYRTARAVALAAGLGWGAACAGAAIAIDVNTATAEQLEQLRGIGPKTAQTIIRERARSGPFHSLQDFTERIRGIGPKRAAALQASGLRVGGGSVGPTPVATSFAGLPEPVITEVAPFERR